MIYFQAQTFKVLSQLPVQRAIPSGETERQLTLFSCPERTATRSPFSVSQTLQFVSSYPANNSLPERENEREVIPDTIFS